MTDDALPPPFRSGYVALVGRPNVGKSTLLNQLVGQKIAATTRKPQTTRRNLLGVLNPEGAQVLLLDTPGHHQAKGPLHRFMVRQVRAAVQDADVIAYVVDGSRAAQVSPGNERLIQELAQAEKPLVVVVNKIDLVKRKGDLLPFMQCYQDALGERLHAMVPISATRRHGLDDLVKALAGALPEAPAFYDAELVTDSPERAIASELIREKVMLETHQELPYASAVTIDSFEDMRPKLVRIQATLHVERSSQKGIVIGKGGQRLKAIGERARHELERFLDSKVYLELHVRLNERWSERRAAVVDLGYDEEFGP